MRHRGVASLAAFLKERLKQSLQGRMGWRAGGPAPRRSAGCPVPAASLLSAVAGVGADLGSDLSIPCVHGLLRYHGPSHFGEIPHAELPSGEHCPAIVSDGRDARLINMLETCRSHKEDAARQTPHEPRGPAQAPAEQSPARAGMVKRAGFARRRSSMYSGLEETAVRRGPLPCVPEEPWGFGRPTPAALDPQGGHLPKISELPRRRGTGCCFEDGRTP